MEMECRNCSRSIKIGDGLKCCKCDSRYHMKCVSDSLHRHAGDTHKNNWRCYTCKVPTPTSTRKYPPQKEDSPVNSVSNVVNSINEKMELISKIQLAKLSTDVSQLKSITDVITKQNVEILRKLTQNNKQIRKQTQPSPRLSVSPSPMRKGFGHRGRRLNPLARIFRAIFGTKNFVRVRNQQ